MRQRELLIQYASSHVQHIQKALTQMNLQLTNVVDSVTGITGLKIIRAILMGERSPEKLAAQRDRRCKQSEETIAKSLEGHYRNEHLFALKQAVDLYDCYQNKILECDKEIEKLTHSMAQLSGSSEVYENKKKPRKHRNGLAFDPRAHLKQLTGVDLTEINGLDSHSILRLIGEVGLDMNKWPTAKHFGSWLCLAPGSKISGGKVLSSKTTPSNNRAANILRIGASTLHHSSSALGAFLRRQKARLGAPKAITATAYKIARIFYLMLKYKKDFKDAGQEYYENQYRERILYNMQRKAQKLGFQMIPIDNALEAA
jgi:transposase